jgi:hypothetical protein
VCRVTHEGMCALTVRRLDGETDTAVLPVVDAPERLGVWTVSKTQLGRMASSYLMERVTAGRLDCRDGVARET